MFIGGIIAALGLFICSFATSFITVIISFGAITGSYLLRVLVSAFQNFKFGIWADLELMLLFPLTLSYNEKYMQLQVNKMAIFYIQPYIFSS